MGAQRRAHANAVSEFVDSLPSNELVGNSVYSTRTKREPISRYLPTAPSKPLPGFAGSSTR